MPHSAIDTPLERLPAVDEHSAEVDAPAEATWAALFPSLRSACEGRLGRWTARRLRCAEVSQTGDLHHPGGTLPGFVVSRAVAPVMLALLGRHRFSRYALVIRIDLLPGQRSRLRIETRARFDGTRGKFYRGLIVGTRGHALVTRALLRDIRRRAERSAAGG